ncbi:mannitol-1-phosphate 5-dehydrogenase [Aquibacillus salsiterrae]|uniref:Mannitol-1-phosphate 5-dehydrogenase n=1 Tax=Aquibacillus salsiterrae TaxID=2950439 RepID=A0A9X4AG54_9BACI|nr:mannitol-1-phosphate 5-dehydrogenase [Aquibacillus salsiterrae]MDC3416920.1 mannitol-1-phosphate 5-dehydrogenase [Aquibacillus salsiterrae]
MLAVHFGAGNIGRGFIGSLLYQSGYHTAFVDVNQTVIDAINQKKKYKVVLAAEEKAEQIVENISGYNSSTQREEIIQQIAKADIVTTAVGPSILPMIAETLAAGLTERLKENKQPLVVIACENMIGGSSLLKEKVAEKIGSSDKEAFLALISFPNAAVDRIVPNQTNRELLTVSVEPYFEWVVEEKDIKGEKPPVEGVTYVPDLLPFIERKLFTVNTGHAVCAYVGKALGYDTIKEAIDEQEVASIVAGALRESGKVLIELYQFNKEEHLAYIDKIVTRFSNPYISDEVTRVGRGPIRKLGPNDRLIRPASLYVELFNETPRSLVKAIAATLVYQNEADEEAVLLQQKVAEQGYQATLEEVSGLAANHPLVKAVLDQIN